MLVDLTVKEFLNKVAGSDTVPGGGSIAALNGAVASALAAMVANLTIGKKGYEEHEELMKHISEVALQVKDTLHRRHRPRLRSLRQRICLLQDAEGHR